jgi:uncharacterized damage-inducible protein DinB
MTIKEWLLPEFDHEMALTRQVLERLPEDAFGWRPHEKSFHLGGLATHLAQIPRWGRWILQNDFYDLAGTIRAEEQVSRAGVLDVFDGHVADVRRDLVACADAALQAPWALKRGSHVLMSLPRFAAFERFLLSHTIHHRGQMTVYLRLHNVPLPPLYGPTADN